MRDIGKDPTIVIRIKDSHLIKGLGNKMTERFQFVVGDNIFFN